MTRGAYALADQAVVSLGTFLTSILLVRNLPLHEYGAYALIAGFLLFLNGFPVSLVLYPMSVKGAEADAAGLRRLARGSLGLVAVLTVPLGVAAAGAVWFTGRLELVPVVLATLVLWQLQETLRRALLAHLRHGEALWGDALSYLGQATLVFALAQAGRLSVETAFGAIAVTSAAAAVVQAVQLRLAHAAPAEPWRLARDFFPLGRWAMLTSLLSLVTLQGIPWTLAAVHGLGAVASFDAVANLLRFAHPVMLSVGNLIVPAAARAAATGGQGAAVRAAAGYAGQGMALLLPYYAVLLLWPREALETLYGSGSPYLALETPLRAFTLFYVLNYLGAVLEALLNGLKRSRSTFLVHVAMTVAMLVVNLPLAAATGVLGATVGLVGVNAVRVVACLVSLRREPTLEATGRGSPAMAVRSR